MNRCPTCNVPIGGDLVACKPHWFSLPKSMRDRIWALFTRERGSDEHRTAVFEAVQLLRHNAAAKRSPWSKTCDACSRVHDAAAWLALPCIGEQRVPATDDQPAEVLELRNCTCGSTISVRRDPESREAAELVRLKSTLPHHLSNNGDSMSLYNALFGVNPLATLLLGMLNLDRGEVGRFRDCFLTKGDDGQPRIVIYTRNGGGNREEYQGVLDTLSKHPCWVRDYDDDFDSTYASIEFRVPEELRSLAEGLLGLQGTPPESVSARFKELVDQIKAGDSSNPAVLRAKEIGKQISEAISKAATP